MTEQYTMWHTLKLVFGVIIMFQSIFFASYLLSRKRRKRIANRILIAFLVVIAIMEVNTVVWHFLELHDLLMAYFPLLFILLFPFRFLYVPLLYLYVSATIHPEFRFRRCQIFHAVPFIGVMLFFISRFGIITSSTFAGLFEYDGYFLTDTESNIYSLLGYVQFFVYMALSLLALRRSRSAMKSQTGVAERISRSWLTYVVTGFVAWKSLSLLNTILVFMFGEGIPITVSIVLFITAQAFFLVFLSVMFFKGLHQPVVFMGDNTEEKYKKIALPEAMKEMYRDTLLQYMERQKPFMDSSLSLKDLAEKVSMPTHHLSQVLNTVLGQSFFEFVNSYRVAESIRILADDTAQSKTILEVLYQSGFNSKSVFNTAFKKHTGVTPSQFRKQHCA